MSQEIPSTMLAFRLDPTSTEKHPTRATVPVPKDLAADEVLLKINAAGLCHSDLWVGCEAGLVGGWEIKEQGPRRRMSPIRFLVSDVYPINLRI